MGVGNNSHGDDGKSVVKLVVKIIPYLAGFSQKMALDPEAFALNK